MRMRFKALLVQAIPDLWRFLVLKPARPAWIERRQTECCGPDGSIRRKKGPSLVAAAAAILAVNLINRAYFCGVLWTKRDISQLPSVPLSQIAKK